MANKDVKQEIKALQLKMLRIQQGIWHKKDRAIIVFEGVDAAGKGGAIRKVTQKLDPRGVQVHPIGPPTPDEQGKHYLYRFWNKLPSAGNVGIFDRSWYGRLLVERVENLTEKENWQRAYEEINQFEKMLRDDGIHLVKIFLSISKEEQLKRFQKRLNNPYKQWKLTMDDIRARKKWNDYQKAIKDLLQKTNTKHAPWTVISTDDKKAARREVLQAITKELKSYEKWVIDDAMVLDKTHLSEALQEEHS